MRRLLTVLLLVALPAGAQTPPKDRVPPAPPRDDVALLADADAAAGERSWRQCRACHAIEPGRHGIGPSLHGILGAPVGAQPGYAYSPVLAALGGTWTVTRLSAYLENPRAFAPGTRMAYAGMRDPQDRLNLIAWLARTGG